METERGTVIETTIDGVRVCFRAGKRSPVVSNAALGTAARGRLLWPFMRLGVARDVERQLRRLKQMLEAET